MPTRREREYYRIGFRDGYNFRTRDPEGFREPRGSFLGAQVEVEGDTFAETYRKAGIGSKRKLSAWQKYIKNKRNHIKYRDGKLNLKAMGVAYRRKKRR
jgi:hypothetical protein